jgi:hypothetical protein
MSVIARAIARGSHASTRAESAAAVIGRATVAR